MPVDELDASNAGEFKRDIAPVLQANTKLVLDLSRLRFVDSSGLGAMLSCLRQLSAKSGDLKLCGMSKQVRGAFRTRAHAPHLRYLRHERRGSDAHSNRRAQKRTWYPACMSRSIDTVSELQESIQRHATILAGKALARSFQQRPV